ncbi:hypothetical protein KIN20_010699 [Parelaphostrongylus tenuis]|uniref:Uncharacterized protein n=1 Tax=Parelaphostrongylus tenuis TaxID=148309 RepID=A0AAD5QPB4_PARTN|nr:hypothetical protein KIN20_010699 [Parelaphostrongylus tenuis]
MTRLPNSRFMILLPAFLPIVLGCGVMPAGQARTTSFTVTGFTLPVAMVYSTAADAPARVPGIATSEAGARGFVERLVMQTVLDVLQSQGRSALLPDAVISAILSQLNVTVTYTPLMCSTVHVGLADMATMFTMMQTGCIVVGNAVTGICTHKERAAQKCMLPTDRGVTLTPVSGPPLTISGSLSTTNVVMATWSRTMWHSVLNRAVRVLAMGPYRSHFFSATATVGGI